MKKRFLPNLFFCSAILLAFGFSNTLEAKIIYVNQNATGSGNGTDWANAMPLLQSAIDVAVKGDTIFVAQGMYLPTSKFSGDTDRHLTFYINKDVVLYGGFEGVAGTEGNLGARNMLLFSTTLSGNLGDVGDTLDNAFHVVYIDHVSDTMRLDGFIISEGNTFNAGGLDAIGAGIFINAEAGRCHPVIADCNITTNHASESGGGVMVYASFGGKSNPTFLRCRIEDNHGSGGGGVTLLTDTDGQTNPTFISCYFRANAARTAQGGAISAIAHSAFTSPQLINCIVTGNFSPTSAAVDIFVTGTAVAQPKIVNSTIAGNGGGAVRVGDIGLGTSTLTVRNSILSGNNGSHGLTANGATADVTHSIMQFGFNGEGNIGLSPEFVDPPSSDNTPHGMGDVHLKAGSPGIDAGNNNEVPADVTTDAAGLSRFIDITTGESGGVVDMGAFEVQEAITSVTASHQRMEWAVYPNPASTEVTINLPVIHQDAIVSIWSSNGQWVSQKEINQGDNTIKLSVNDLLPGLYQIRIVTGDKYDVRKLVVE